MKTTITLSVDVEAKKRVMPIVQNQMKSCLSKEVNDLFWKIIDREKKGEFNHANN